MNNLNLSSTSFHTFVCLFNHDHLENLLDDQSNDSERLNQLYASSYQIVVKDENQVTSIWSDKKIDFLNEIVTFANLNNWQEIATIINECFHTMHSPQECRHVHDFNNQTLSFFRSYRNYPIQLLIKLKMDHPYVKWVTIIEILNARLNYQLTIDEGKKIWKKINKSLDNIPIDKIQL